jgi:hypothetical protein
MPPVPIVVEGMADRVLVKGLDYIRPVLDALDGSVIIIGGLMVRIALTAVPPELPIRGTADIDIGVDRRSLGFASSAKKIAPLLEEQGFAPGAVHPEDQFRFGKEIEGDTFVVDLLVAPGSSRDEPPVLEEGITTLAAPGLAYALLRGIEPTEVEFLDGDHTSNFVLPMPRLDAAFVLKAALAESGVRNRSDRQRVDTVDSLLLAAALLQDAESILALRDHRGRSDVKKSIRWLGASFADNESSGVARVVEYFRDEFATEVDPQYAVRVAAQLVSKIESHEDPNR